MLQDGYYTVAFQVNATKRNALDCNHKKKANSPQENCSIFLEPAYMTFIDIKMVLMLNQRQHKQNYSVSLMTGKKLRKNKKKKKKDYQK